MSTKNIFPGSNLPCCTTSSGFISRTPISDDMITKPLFVSVYRDGRNPFLSNNAPITFPSVKGIEAGPSQGSMIQELYS